MRTRITAAALTAATLLLSLTACDSDDQEAKTVTTPKAPAYTVADKREKTETGSVDLVVPDANVDSAKAAVKDYAKTIGDQFLHYGITVVLADDPKVYICMVEWVKNKQAAKVYTGGRIESHTWPALSMLCSAPKG